MLYGSNNEESSGDKHIAINVSSSDKTQMAIVWDGLNAKYRQVASGAYLMIISYTSSDGETWRTHRISVGVKR